MASTAVPAAILCSFLLQPNFTLTYTYFFCKNWNLLILEKNQLTVYSAKAVFLN